MELSSHPTARRIREKGDRTAPSVELLTWRVRVRGPIGLLRRFGRCFPS